MLAANSDFQKQQSCGQNQPICGFDSSLGPWIPTLAPFVGCSVSFRLLFHLLFAVSCRDWTFRVLDFYNLLICVCFSYFPFYIFSGLCLMAPVYLSCTFSIGMFGNALKVKKWRRVTDESLTHVCAWLLDPTWVDLWCSGPVFSLWHDTCSDLWKLESGGVWSSVGLKCLLSMNVWGSCMAGCWTPARAPWH